jgi:hypothetical protein
MASRPRRCRWHHVFPPRPAGEPSTITRDRGFLEDPAVAVGIVDEAVSGLVQRQEHGAQTEGTHSLGGRASGGVPYRHRDVRLPEFLPVIGPMDDVVVIALALRYAARQVPRQATPARPVAAPRVARRTGRQLP